MMVKAVVVSLAMIILAGCGGMTDESPMPRLIASAVASSLDTPLDALTVADYTNVQVLDLTNMPITDGDLPFLARMPNLRGTIAETNEHHDRQTTCQVE
jgi:hypothetical protein